MSQTHAVTYSREHWTVIFFGGIIEDEHLDMARDELLFFFISKLQEMSFSPNEFCLIILIEAAYIFGSKFKGRMGGEMGVAE